MIFSIGERVRFLYAVGEGEIIEAKSGNHYLVRDEVGFETIFQAEELVKIHNADRSVFENVDLSMCGDSNLSGGKHIVKKEQLTGSRRPIDIWEIDLHIEELTDAYSELSNYEILSLQMKAFKMFYEKARSKRIRKIIAIHGVGEGVLREEIRNFLYPQEGVEFYDADYREYGKGATAVEIRYNIVL